MRRSDAMFIVSFIFIFVSAVNNDVSLLFASAILLFMSSFGQGIVSIWGIWRLK